MNRILASLALFALLSTPTLAHDASHEMSHDPAAPTAPAGPVVTVGDLEITGAFSRATLPNAPVGAGYLTILNKGTSDDRLVSASSPVAGTTQIHEMKMEGDVMKMNEVEGGLVIPAGGIVTLAPGGFHIMFMKLNQQLVEGTKVPLTVTFEKAGTVDMELAVGAVNADEPACESAEH
jgi:copper(I)-binding protein